MRRAWQSDQAGNPAGLEREHAASEAPFVQVV